MYWQALALVNIFSQISDLFLVSTFRFMRDIKQTTKTPLFRTLVPCTKSTAKILPSSKSLFIGSCFTQNIGQKFRENGLNICTNPFGVVYNPVSISQQLMRLSEDRPYVLADLLLHNGLYHTFDHHSRFSDVDATCALEKINEEYLRGVKALINSDFLFVTFGSAFVYSLKDSNDIVANCHKYPSKIFNKRVLEVSEIVEMFNVILTSLTTINPDLTVVFSVSPIRHLADGFVENNVSKSTLLLAVNQIVSKSNNAVYFPAYEIVLDELRDYRFFAEDMVHPTQTAIDYIWSRVKESFMDDSITLMMSDLERINRDLAHRPFNPESEEYRKFSALLDERIIRFKSRYPEIELFNTR